MKIRCNFEETLRKSSSRSENKVELGKGSQKINRQTWEKAQTGREGVHQTWKNSQPLNSFFIKCSECLETYNKHKHIFFIWGVCVCVILRKICLTVYCV